MDDDGADDGRLAAACASADMAQPTSSTGIRTAEASPISWLLAPNRS
jgi:hypothetical protein